MQIKYLIRFKRNMNGSYMNNDSDIYYEVGYDMQKQIL